MKNYTVGEYLIMLERNLNGSVSVSAIPDRGDTLRRTFYGYTTKAIKAEVAAMIQEATK
jgi:hypothetical protein